MATREQKLTLIKYYADAHFLDNIEKNKIDYNKLYKKEPLLFDMLFDYYNKENHSFAQSWQRITHTYEELKNHSFLSLIENEIALKQKIEAFRQKVLDKQLYISKNDLSEVLITKKYKNKTQYLLDFNNLMFLFDDFYGIDHHSAYEQEDREETQNKCYKTILGLNKKQIKELKKTADSENVMNIKMNFIDLAINDALPYMSFWHHLLDYEFLDIENGSEAYLNFFPSKNEAEIFTLIRQGLKKELSVFKEFSKSDNVLVWVEW